MNDERIVEFDLSVVSERLTANRAVIVAMTLVVALASVIYTSFNKPIYEAKASIITPIVQVKSASLFGGGSAPGPAGSSTLDMFAAMMQSETAVKTVIEGTKVTRARLKRIREIEIDGASNMIWLRVQHSNRELAIQITDRTIRSLKTLDEELRLSKKRRSMESIADAMEIKSSELEEAEQQLRDFHVKAIADGDLQSVFKLDLRANEATLTSLTATVDELKGRLSEAVGDSSTLSLETVPAKELRTQLVSAQVDLATKQTTLAPEHPDIVALNRRVAALTIQIRIEIDNYLLAVDWGLIGENDPEGLATLETQRVMAQSKVTALRQIVEKMPDESLKMRTLTARSGQLQVIVNQLASQYESAKIEFATDPQSWSVLDEPYADEKPINKNKVRSGVIGAFIGFVLGLFFAMRRK